VFLPARLNSHRSVHLRGWIVPGLVLCLACSDGSERSGSLPESADFLPMSGDSEPASSLAIVLDSLGGEQPRLIFRCEGGRVSAYVMVRTAAEADPEPNDPGVVPVRLDSAPAC
jgi:hypothetical protein